jgi:hypothetical protein
MTHEVKLDPYFSGIFNAMNDSDYEPAAHLRYVEFNTILADFVEKTYNGVLYYDREQVLLMIKFNNIGDLTYFKLLIDSQWI